MLQMRGCLVQQVMSALISTTYLHEMQLLRKISAVRGLTVDL